MSDMICPGCGIRMFSEKAFREHAQDCPELNKPEEVVQEPSEEGVGGTSSEVEKTEPPQGETQDQAAPEGASQEEPVSGDSQEPQGLDETQEASQAAPETQTPEGENTPAPEPDAVPAPTGGDVIPTKDMSVEELRKIAEERAIPGAETMKKSQLFKVLFIDPQKAPQE